MSRSVSFEVWDDVIIIDAFDFSLIVIIDISSFMLFFSILIINSFENEKN